MKESAEQNWSSRLLERHIKTGYYRRLLSTLLILADEPTGNPDSKNGNEVMHMFLDI